MFYMFQFCGPTLFTIEQLDWTMSYLIALTLRTTGSPALQCPVPGSSHQKTLLTGAPVKFSCDKYPTDTGYGITPNFDLSLKITSYTSSSRLFLDSNGEDHGCPDAVTLEI